MLHVDLEHGVEEVLTVAGWIQVAPGTLMADVVRIDTGPQRVVMFDDVNGAHHVIPMAAVCGYRTSGPLEQYVNPRPLVHSYSGADGALPSSSPRYPPSNVR